MTAMLAPEPIGRIYVTNEKGGVSCWPIASWAELEQRIRRTFRQKQEAVAYADDPSEEGGRRVIGRVENDFNDGWTWWCEAEERTRGGAP